MNIKLKFIISVFILLLLSCETYQSNRPTNEKITALIQKSIKQYDISGLSISISNSQGILYSNAFGLANENQNFAVETLSSLKSVSKPFTCLGIMKLVNNGLIDLDTPVNFYLPEFTPKTWGPDPSKITIRTLLTHQSGLQSEYTKKFYFEETFTKLSNYENKNLLENISKTTLTNEIDTISSYSNLGFGVLELVIEKVTGEKYFEYMKEEVLNPIGMKNSSYIYNEELNNLYAFGNEKGQWKDRKVGRMMASGDLVSSANDMSKFMMYILKNFHNTSFKEMWKIQNSNSKLDFDKEQLLTWYIVNSNTIPVRKYIGHGGDGYPFHASILLDPQYDIGITIIVNGMNGISNDLMDISISIFKILEKEYGSANLTEIKSVFNTTRKEITPSLEEEIIGNWVGGTGIINIFNEKSKMKMNLLGKDFNIYYHGDNEFSIGYKFYGIFPLNILNIENYSLKLENVNGSNYFQFMYLNDQVEVLQKIEAKELSDTWTSKLGSTWRCINSSDNDGAIIESAKLLKDQNTGFYCIEYNIDGYKILKPIAERDNYHLYFLGVGRDLGETVTYNKDNEGKEYLEYSGLIFERTD